MHETLELNQIQHILEIQGYSPIRSIKCLVKADGSEKLSPGNIMVSHLCEFSCELLRHYDA